MASAAALSICSAANANQPETIKRDITEFVGEITDNIPLDRKRCFPFGWYQTFIAKTRAGDISLVYIPWGSNNIKDTIAYYHTETEIMYFKSRNTENFDDYKKRSPDDEMEICNLLNGQFRF